MIYLIDFGSAMDILIDFVRDFGNALVNFVAARFGWDKEQVEFLTKILGLISAVSTIVAAVVGILWKILKKKKRVSIGTAKRIAREAVAHAREDMQREVQARDDLIKSLTAAIQALPAALQVSAKAGLPVPSIDEILRLVAAGHTQEAEAAFSYVLENMSRRGVEANKEAATAARHLGSLAFLNDTNKALEAYTRATELDPENPEGWNLLGILLKRVGRLDDALRAFERTLALSGRLADKNREASAYVNLGPVYQSQGDRTRAEESMRKGLKLYDELGYREGMALAYVSLGSLYQGAGDSRAEEMALKGLKLFDELRVKEGVAAGYALLAVIYQMQGDDRAEEMALKGLKLFEELGTKPGIAASYTCLGGIYSMRGDSRAEETMLKGLRLYEDLNYREALAGGYTMLAMFYKSRGNASRAEDIALKGLKLFEQMGAKDGLAATHGILGEIYQQQGDKMNACMHWTKARDLYVAIGVPGVAKHFEELMRAENCLQ
jgi:protein O-GlcNAc transferase